MNFLLAAAITAGYIFGCLAVLVALKIHHNRDSGPAEELFIANYRLKMARRRLAQIIKCPDTSSTITVLAYNGLRESE